jgi:hypothetical protein
MWTPRRIRGRAHGLMVRLGGGTARALGGLAVGLRESWIFRAKLVFSGSATEVFPRSVTGA